jgi:hypothetical protein
VKVGDRVKYIGTYYTIGIGEHRPLLGRVASIDDNDWPVEVQFDGELFTFPCNEDELEVIG